jgi:Flp pilus assembly pilin Flp
MRPHLISRWRAVRPTVQRWLHRAIRQEAEAQGLVEYAMIIILVVIVVFILVTLLGPWVGNSYSNVINFL